MSILAGLRSLSMKLFRRDATVAEMEEELRSHVAHRADDLVRSGFSREEAERRARVEFGGREHYKEESYAALGGNFMQTLVQDLSFAVRILRKSKGFTLAAVVTLALAIGANAVVFGVMDALVLHTINVPDAKSIYGTQYGADVAFQSYPSYVDLRDRNHSFEDLAAFNFTLGTAIDPGNDPKAAGGRRPGITSRFWMCIHILAGCIRRRTAWDGKRAIPGVELRLLAFALSGRSWRDRARSAGEQACLHGDRRDAAGAFGTIMFVQPDFFLPIVEQEMIGESLTNGRTLPLSSRPSGI